MPDWWDRVRGWVWERERTQKIKCKLFAQINCLFMLLIISCPACSVREGFVHFQESFIHQTLNIQIHGHQALFRGEVHPLQGFVIGTGVVDYPIILGVLGMKGKYVFEEQGHCQRQGLGVGVDEPVELRGLHSRANDV